MPIYDFHCECGEEKEDVMCSFEDEVLCDKCSKPMVRKCNCSHFKLLYDPKKDTVGWGYDGYATTQYWKDVKEARARGEKVKGATED